MDAILLGKLHHVPKGNRDIYPTDGRWFASRAFLLHNFYVNVIIENVLMYFLALLLFVPRHLFGDAYSASMGTVGGVATGI